MSFALGIGTVSSASFVNEHTVKLFIFHTRRSEGGLLFGYFFECRVERHIVLTNHPLFHPDAKIVGLVHCMLSNVITFRVIARSKLSVEIARDGRSMCFCCSDSQ